MPKAIKVPIGFELEGSEYQIHIWCPGCGYEHALSPKIHTFNEDYEHPTFSPSLLQKYSDGRVCHSFVRDGVIDFLNDSTHGLVGQYPLPDIEVEIQKRKEKHQANKNHV